MATINPPGLYTEGSAVFNSQPVAQIYHQQVLRKQARDEALDDYFRNQYKNINPAGMRQQDIGGLMQKTKEWNDFYQQNKEAIKNPKLDDGKSISEYQARYQDQLGYIQKSKDRAEIKKELGKARLNPNTSFIFDDDEILKEIEQDDRPLNDPEHKPIDLYKLSIQPKPIDVKEWQALQKSSIAGLKPSEIVDKIEVDPKTLDTITTVKKQYSQEDLQAVGNRYKSMYQLDRRVRATADKNLLNAPNANELAEIYRQTYGRAAETPADLLAAQGILNAQSEGIVQKRTPGSLEQKRLLESIRQGNREQLVKMRRQFKKEDKAIENLWLQEYMGKLFKDAEVGELREITINGKQSQEHSIALDPVLAKALTIGRSVPERVTITPDGRIRALYYEYKDGKIVKHNGKNVIDKNLSAQTISPEQLKLAISKQAQSTTQRATEMTGQQQTQRGEYDDL